MNTTLRGSAQRQNESKRNHIMTTFTISNITFELTEYAIEFSFLQRFGSNEWATASLQLPDIGESQHSILYEDYDCDNEIHEAIFEQLKDFYFSEFKDTDCAAASAVLGELITHVEEVNGFYVAFSQHSKHLIKESCVRSYYNKASLFDLLNDEDHMINEDEMLDVDALINKAKKTYFETLSRHLDSKMRDYIKAVDPKTFNDEKIAQCFDEILHEFMSEEFNQFDGDYQKDELAQEFYQMTACDIRCDFENELRELTND